MLLAIVASYALAGAPLVGTPRYTTRDCARTPGGRSTRGTPCGASLAFFEFAPANGAGMGTACACAAVTGAKGETSSVSRAGSAYCTKEGFNTTGLTNTSMVNCGSNVLRVETNPSGDLAALFELGATNSVLQSEDFTNAAWTKNGIGAAAPVVTADQAVTPWGTTTAERVQFAATVATQTSSIFQISCPTGATTASFYIKGNGSSGSTFVFMDQGVSTVCAACTFVSGSWSRCSVSGTVTVSGAAIIGNDSRSGICGTASTSAADVFIAGGQCENSAVATSYIPTTTVAVSRPAETDFSFSGVTLTAMASAGSAAATVTPLATAGLAGGPLVFMNTSGRALYVDGSNRISVFDGTNNPVLAATPLANTPKRYWSSWAGGTITLTNATDVTNTTSAFTGTMNTTGPLAIGANGTLGTSSWLISRVCLDPVATRCR